jgi:uncharacterized hydrophobic protein (TIGR00271 family)
MESKIASSSPMIKLGFDPNYLQAFEAKLFVEGAQTNRRLLNFFALLFMASVIATYGVLSDSTATVIGAMIVAPLMEPIMALTAAVVMGSPRRVWRSLALAIAGILSVILFSILLTWIVPDFTISFTKNGELASRISPGLYALLTALGAGAAGAFIISRAEIADSMGGVAIAISLVPPLCVVGIAISQGNWGAAGGALLLFLTNFLAILLAGGLIFLLVGLGKLGSEEAHSQLRRRSFTLIIIGTLIVAIPLSLSSYHGMKDIIAKNKATNVVSDWLKDTAYKIVSVKVTEESVEVTVEGERDLNSPNVLAEELEKAIGHPVALNLSVVPLETIMSSGNLSP